MNKVKNGICRIHLVYPMFDLVYGPDYIHSSTINVTFQFVVVFEYIIPYLPPNV